ncbi:MAG TPA: ABC transporter ATP-binding protein [Syntrophorhabdales bacterium]|nr:ABC transporter ATP-binding protein [Syntrophorhabdales bacterium]
MSILAIQGLTHKFGGLTAVSDLNLTLNAHELVGVIGPNGAGKTTVFNIISGVYRPSRGSILLEGVELVGKSPSQITNLGIARTFQNIRLFRELSVLDNVRIAHYGQVRYNALEALFHVGRFKKEEARIIEHSMELLALLRIDAAADVQAKNLPYGLQRRVEIARALATRPRLLLLDEPAAGMNPNEIDQLMDLIHWIRDEFNLTTLLIEHQMALVMSICERLLVLDFGETIAEGRPEEIQSDQRVLEAYLGDTVT